MCIRDGDWAVVELESPKDVAVALTALLSRFKAQQSIEK